MASSDVNNGRANVRTMLTGMENMLREIREGLAEDGIVPINYCRTLNEAAFELFRYSFLLNAAVDHDNTERTT